MIGTYDVFFFIFISSLCFYLTGILIDTIYLGLDFLKAIG